MPATTNHRQLPPLSAPQAQETRDVQRYLGALFGRESPGALIDVRWRYRGGMSQRFLPHHDTYSAARAILRLGLRSDVYVGVAPRRARGGGKDAIERLWALWVDLDDVDAAAALERLPVSPQVVIASGSPGHLHAYWTLSRPVTVKAAEAANRRLAAELGGDTGAVTNAATILRPPGTHSFKTRPPTPVVLERLDETLTTLEAVTAGIAADPSPPAPAPRRTKAAAPGAARAGVDPLRALEPALYVGVLTGETVGRSRKVSCPFHADRTPSLHAYENPQDGWYCYGCKRYGHTVYDLASQLWQLDTRGPSFIELRARLYDLFLPGHAPPAAPRGHVRRSPGASARPAPTPRHPDRPSGRASGEIDAI
jgi:hypothetical protein